MRLIRNYLRLLLPTCHILNAECNQVDPNASIRTMGERLAEEFNTFVLGKCPELADPQMEGRVTFVGHSAGAVILRAALTVASLRPFLSKMHAFISISGPHLGTLYSSTVVQTGIWAMKKWSRSSILNELCLTDAASGNVADSLLYWLTTQPSFEYFSYVVLVSARKDEYVPMHSARIQCCEAAIKDARKGNATGRRMAEMVQNLLGPLDKCRVFRMNLYSLFEEANFDTMIGRAAHIGILDSPQLVQLVLCSLHDFLSPPSTA